MPELTTPEEWPDIRVGITVNIVGRHLRAGQRAVVIARTGPKGKPAVRVRLADGTLSYVPCDEWEPLTTPEGNGGQVSIASRATAEAVAAHLRAVGFEFESVWPCENQIVIEVSKPGIVCFRCGGTGRVQHEEV